MRLTIGIALTLILVFSLSAVAYAATPQDIYNDFADNGKLDGTYTNEELQAYLDDATVQQYGDEAILDELDRLVRDMLATSADQRSTFPFTGSLLAITVALALALVCGGLILRRRTAG